MGQRGRQRGLQEAASATLPMVSAPFLRLHATTWARPWALAAQTQPSLLPPRGLASPPAKTPPRWRAPGQLTPKHTFLPDERGLHQPGSKPWKSSSGVGESEGRECVGEKPPAQEPREAHTPWETQPWPSEQPRKQLSKKLRTRRFAASANDC